MNIQRERYIVIDTSFRGLPSCPDDGSQESYSGSRRNSRRTILPTVDIPNVMIQLKQPETTFSLKDDTYNDSYSSFAPLSFSKTLKRRLEEDEYPALLVLPPLENGSRRGSKNNHVLPAMHSIPSLMESSLSSSVLDELFSSCGNDELQDYEVKTCKGETEEQTSVVTDTMTMQSTHHGQRKRRRLGGHIDNELQQRHTIVSSPQNWVVMPLAGTTVSPSSDDDKEQSIKLHDENCSVHNEEENSQRQQPSSSTMTMGNFVLPIVALTANMIEISPSRRRRTIYPSLQN